MRDKQTISRRTLLGSVTTLAIGVSAAGGFSRQAAAQQKVSKAEAKYQDQPKFNGQQRCEICLQFEAPNGCKIVEGQIRPKGWCQFFAARENAR